MQSLLGMLYLGKILFYLMIILFSDSTSLKAKNNAVGVLENTPDENNKQGKIAV